jgi:hypothetical protein
LHELAAVTGKAASSLPETSFLVLETSKHSAYFTILRDSAHSNVAQLFHERDRRLTSEDRLTVVNGLLGAYPNALFSVRSPARFGPQVISFTRAGNCGAKLVARVRTGVDFRISARLLRGGLTGTGCGSLEP